MANIFRTPEERAAFLQQGIGRPYHSDVVKRLFEQGNIANVGDVLRVRLPGLIGYDPAKPDSEQTALTVYNVGSDEHRPATQADIDDMQRMINRLRMECRQLQVQRDMAQMELQGLKSQERDTSTSLIRDFNRVCRMLENANGGAPVWFENPIKGDVLSGHQFDGNKWQKLQMVEPSPEIDRIWETIRDASVR